MHLVHRDFRVTMAQMVLKAAEDELEILDAPEQTVDEDARAHRVSRVAKDNRSQDRKASKEPRVPSQGHRGSSD